MKISSRGIYGLTALMDLAEHSTDGAVTISSISSRQNLSVKYLEQTFPLLKKAGIVKSILGANGGYVLGAFAKDITIKSILVALEGNISVIADNYDNDNSIKMCLKKYIFDEVDQLTYDFLEKISLQDMIDHQKEENQKENIMFFI